jgi:hypothetical protein
MSTVSEEIDAIDDRVREATETLNESGTQGERLKNEFEGIWEAIRLIASRIDEAASLKPW